MLDKPPVCRGCPFYGDGRGFVPDELRPGAPVLIYGQNPGEQEEAAGRPFVGKTGEVMFRDYAKLAGLTREDVSLANALRCRWRDSNDLPHTSSKVLRAALRHCTNAHFRVPDGTRLVVATGDYAALALTGDASATNWRGWLVPLLGSPAFGEHLSSIWVPGPREVPVFVTAHIARLFHDPGLILPTLADWRKIPRILHRQWPLAPPAPLTTQPATWPAEVALDTEYTEETGRLLRLSVAAPDGRVWVVEAPDLQPFRFEVESPHIIVQNAQADLSHLLRFYAGPYQIDDTMLAHSVLYSEQPHTLDYLGSLYSSMSRWKHLANAAPVAYSGADAWGTLEVWRALVNEFVADPLSKRVYLQYLRPLIPILYRARREGRLVDHARIAEVLSVVTHELDAAVAQLQAVAGWPINIASVPQVGHQIYAVEGAPTPRGAQKRRK